MKNAAIKSDYSRDEKVPENSRSAKCENSNTCANMVSAEKASSFDAGNIVMACASEKHFPLSVIHLWGDGSLRRMAIVKGR